MAVAPEQMNAILNEKIFRFAESRSLYRDYLIAIGINIATGVLNYGAL